MQAFDSQQYHPEVNEKWGHTQAYAEYQQKGKAGADVLTFENRNGNWVETNWETAWSASGSASEVVYPYWWHFIYSGF